MRGFPDQEACREQLEQVSKATSYQALRTPFPAEKMGLLEDGGGEHGDRNSEPQESLLPLLIKTNKRFLNF